MLAHRSGTHDVNGDLGERKMESMELQTFGCRKGSELGNHFKRPNLEVTAMNRNTFLMKLVMALGAEGKTKTVRHNPAAWR